MRPVDLYDTCSCCLFVQITITVILTGCTCEILRLGTPVLSIGISGGHTCCRRPWCLTAKNPVIVYDSLQHNKLGDRTTQYGPVEEARHLIPVANFKVMMSYRSMAYQFPWPKTREFCPLSHFLKSSDVVWNLHTHIMVVKLVSTRKNFVHQLAVRKMRSIIFSQSAVTTEQPAKLLRHWAREKLRKWHLPCQRFPII